MTVGKAPVAIVFAADHDLHMGAWQVGWHDDGKPRMAGLFNGRIDSPRIASKALIGGEMSEMAQTTSPDRDWLIAAWDFGRDIPDRPLPGSFGQPSRRPSGQPADPRGHRLSLGRLRTRAGHASPSTTAPSTSTTTIWSTPAGKPALPLPFLMTLKAVSTARAVGPGDNECYIPFFVRPAKDALKPENCFPRLDRDLPRLFQQLLADGRGEGRGSNAAASSPTRPTSCSCTNAATSVFRPTTPIRTVRAWFTAHG